MNKACTRIWMLFLLLLVGWQCEKAAESTKVNYPRLLYNLQMGLMNVVSEDLFPPPVASRIYAYTHLAGYEALASYSEDIPSFSKWIPGLQIDTKGGGDPLVAYLEAIFSMSKNLVYRDHLVNQLRIQIFNELGIDTTEMTYRQGLETSEEIAEVIYDYAKEDGYDQTRTAPKYMLNELPQSWQPTAPTFGEALEPFWGTLRPFFLDSANQFRSSPSVKFDTDPDSDFYNQAMEVQGYVSRADADSVAVAVYWDCNPGPTMLDGHFMQVRKQNTPGGHWLGITAQMIIQQGLTHEKGAYLLALVSMGMADGFICAWDTKFTYDLLRPETYINKYIDSDWKPKLESPLFPEYSSAHSVVSAVAAGILTTELGNQVSFIDSTNASFGYPPRSFESFWEAAREAATSRLLGGIHYPFACNEGFRQGEQIGEFINELIASLD